MDSIFVQLKDIIEGTSNFNTWKARVINSLEEHDLDSFVTFVIKEPTKIAGRPNYKKNQEKEKRIIYDSVNDNLMLVITPLKATKECFETITNLYEKKVPTQERVLNNKLCNLNMEKDDTVASLFTNISQVKYQLATIDLVTDEDDLLQTSID